MLLAISTNDRPATDLGFLLHKHPDRFQSFDQSFGKAHVFYSHASEDCCTACLLLDIDAVSMARGRNHNPHFLLSQYVNDRPFVASSFMSVAISKVFRSAMSGICNDRPELVNREISLTARIDVLPVRGADGLANRLFEPLGYEVETIRHQLDSEFEEWGESPYHSVTIHGTKRLSDLLTHLYVLIPVFDNQKHYFVSDDELEKLISKGENWLKHHPEKDFVARRYLKNRPSLVRQAMARLVGDEETSVEGVSGDQQEERLEKPMSLNDQRLGAVVAALKASQARQVIDLGCGEGKLLRELLSDWQFERIVGMDVSIRSLEIASKRLKLDRLPPKQAERLELIHGSLMYRDKRFEGFDAAAVVEVIEHLDPPRLAAFERVLFQDAKPKTIVLTTPNSEYNVMWEALPAGQFRHSDHRFEWTREEFQAWANRVASEHGYQVRFLPIGNDDPTVGSPTQMGVFDRE
ncbi:3' terminal RNA ribose 2'-O-methyltransferase Hen1 [Rubinisphaera sp. JC750]|uniref:3' terminal RNA ribose 2'-O-methyltransferase Hen1 n=1 Tax=Rubinisphaera sp. JC750 TaxID=2898658 RepID=UPI001F025514|nr:3' terminal RNA ribose 2'-O-methyltransferase Hen1 [Rubinisphaera sp. JC750]